MINKIIRKHSNFCDINSAVRAQIAIGRDTRESGREICENIKSTLQEFNCKVHDYGIVTTPELHFLVRRSNIENKIVEKETYVKHMASMFLKLTNITGQNCFMSVDTANGVAESKLREINKLMDNKLRFNILNKENGV